MRPSLLLAASAVVLLATGPALSQGDQNGQPLPIATVTCGDISKLPAAYQAALIYYAAGYRDGVDYARASAGAAATTPAPLPTSPTVTSQVPVASAPDASSSAGASSSEPAAAAADGSLVVGGLVLQVQDIVAACAGAPQAFLTDIIANHGGARGPQGSPSAAPATPIGGGGAPASSGAAPASQAPGASSQAPSAATDNGAAAVSSDLGGTSQQLQQDLAPSTAPGTTTPRATNSP